MGPEMMTAAEVVSKARVLAEAAAAARVLLAEDRPLPTDIGRALLEAYDANQKCLYDMETYLELNSPSHIAKRLLMHLAQMREPVPSEAGGTV